MEIQDIQSVTNSLTGLGFSPALGNQILYHACLRKKEFNIREQKKFGTDIVTYTLFFTSEKEGKGFMCSYYDAFLRKEITVDGSVPNREEAERIEEKMKAIDWKRLSQPDAVEQIRFEDKGTWEEQNSAEGVIAELEAMSVSPEGKRLADILRYKYWVDLPLETMISNLFHLKSRLEFSQRFYILHAQGITADEAFRFLNNKWRQRRIQLEKKQPFAEIAKGAEPRKTPKDGLSKKRTSKK